MADELISYCEIRRYFLDSFYENRRRLIKLSQNQKLPPVDQLEEVSYAYYQLENAYDLPVEKLMRDVLTLIMLAGCDAAVFVAYLHKAILDILDRHTLDELLQEIDEDSKSELVYDLIFLGIIDSDRVI